MQQSSHAIAWAFCILPALAVLPPGSAQGDQSLESKYVTNIRQVTTGMVKAGEGYFSPDMKQISYQAIEPDYPFYQIFTQSLDGGPPKRISTGRGRTTCSYFHPNGKQILFASSHLNPNLAAVEAEARKQQEEDRKSGRKRRYSWPFDPYMDIFVADLNGRILKRLTDRYGYDAEGAYSHGGKRIAYCHVEEPADKSAPSGPKNAGQRNPDIWIMNADGSDKRQITTAPGYDGGPFISPDGKWIVFRTDRKRREYLQIHVIGTDGKNEVALTDNNGVNWGPYWHPTRPCLIWAGADHSNPAVRPNYDLYLMRYQVQAGRFLPGPVTRITDSPAADVLPVFSPDGKKLMWTSTRTSNHSSQLFLADFHLPD